MAVKRLLRDFVTLADREVGLLKDADDHPNVIRYYYQEAHTSFLYIALELCPASLADIIERPDQFREIAISFSPKRAVRQITSGLRHLHALKIVHRDIKPQNILVSSAKKGESSGHRMLISDFGLCRKLEVDQTSFLPTAGGAMGVGTFGWRAPEILRGEVKLDEPIADDNSQGSRDSVGTATGSNHSGTGRPTTRLTKLVDIFALGCLYYYCLTNGGHPFGDRFEREVNIIRDQKSLQGLEGFGEEGSEAVDLISAMLAPEAADRCVEYSLTYVASSFSRDSFFVHTQKTQYDDVSYASLFLGPRSAIGILARRFGPFRDHVSRPARSSPRHAGKRRHRCGGTRLGSAAR